MDESRVSEALIIKRGDYREYDSRVVLYTKNFGKTVVVARGVKKFKSKLAGHIEPMSLIKAMILRGRAFDYLGGALVTSSFINLKNDLNGLYYAGAALALLDSQIKEDEPDVELYNFLAYWLELIDEKCQIELDKNQGELLYNYFALQLLVILGYKPELYNCLDCHHKITPSANYFNLRQGGLVCENCFKISQNRYLPNEVIKVSDDCIKLLRLFSQQGAYQSIQVKTELIKELSCLIRSFVIFNN
jgi:DNA repair protein RecO (recombination protein O)